jgi:hypothetical protein
MVLDALHVLHPHEDTPQSPATKEHPVDVTSGILAKVLDVVPRSSAAGSSGWAYQHIKAAASATPKAELAALELMSAMVQEAMPHKTALL